MDVPRRLRVSLERVEHELAQVGRQGIGITQHEDASDRRSFSTFLSKTQSDLQDSREVAGHRPLALVVLQPWKISRRLGDEKRFVRRQEKLAVPKPAKDVVLPVPDAALSRLSELNLALFLAALKGHIKQWRAR